MTIEKASKILYTKFFIRYNHIEADIKKHLKKNGYDDFLLKDKGKRSLLKILEMSVTGEVQKAVKAFIKQIDNNKNLKRFSNLEVGLRETILKSVLPGKSLIVFKKKWCLFDDGGKIVSFYPDWTEDGSLVIDPIKVNARHCIGEAIFHRVDLDKFYPPPIVNYAKMYRSGTEVAFDQIEMDHIRTIFKHMNAHGIKYLL